MSDEFLIPLPASIEAPNAMPIDQASDLALEGMELPPLGGPSGRGWSYYSTEQRCPHLFHEQYIRPQELVRLNVVTQAEADRAKELRPPAIPLQVGALYHTLQALYYGVGLGEALVRDRGLITARLADRLPKVPGRKKLVTIPQDGADQLLKRLKDMADPTNNLALAVEGAKQGMRMPSAAIIAEAERCFDAHTSNYDSDEDVIPLAVEWLAVNEPLNYTCRYDMIGALGPSDPLVVQGHYPAGSVMLYERKTSAWMSEMATDGWYMDGEVLGELLNWVPSGCAEVFGPLAGCVVDIVTKAKVPKFHRVVIPADLPTVHEHARWIQYTRGEIEMHKGSGVWPKRLTQCFDRWGRCGNWYACAGRQP